MLRCIFSQLDSVHYKNEAKSHSDGKQQPPLFPFTLTPLGSEALCSSHRANTAPCAALVIHTSFFFSLIAKRTTLGLPLRIRTFRLPSSSGLKTYINITSWSPWSHSHDLCVVSVQSGDSCTFRLLKHTLTSQAGVNDSIMLQYLCSLMVHFWRPHALPPFPGWAIWYRHRANPWCASHVAQLRGPGCTTSA